MTGMYLPMNFYGENNEAFRNWCDDFCVRLKAARERDEAAGIVRRRRPEPARWNANDYNDDYGELYGS